MVFLEPGETEFDLRWNMLGIHVRVHPMFWLITLAMGWSAINLGWQYLLIWVACVFVSILIHELGHVWMGMAFGSHGHIVLYGFGGLAIGSNHLSSRWQRILVSFAGPLAGFVFLGLVLGLLWLRDPEMFAAQIELLKASLGLPVDAAALAPLFAQGLRQPSIQLELINNLIFINLFWGLMNLLPVWPLDGGQISRDVCEGIWSERGLVISLALSVAVAGVFALHSIMAANGRPLLPIPIGGTYAAILFGLLAVQSGQLLHQAQSRRRWVDDHWDRHEW